MGKRLSQAPVCFTVAQLRFNPVLAMAPHLPSIQDAFRALGFPDYEAIRSQVMEVRATDDGDVHTHSQHRERHLFRNKERTGGLLWDAGSLTYELSDYPVFEEFAKIFLKAVQIIHSNRAIEYSERLGIRMLDAIQPRPGEALNQYILDSALGFADLVPTGLTHEQSVVESVFKFEKRTLMVRTIRLPKGLGMPPDLVPLRLKLRERFLQHNEETVMLDCDSSREARVDFEPEDLAVELTSLKSALTATFRSLVTDHALSAWE